MPYSARVVSSMGPGYAHFAERAAPRSDTDTVRGLEQLTPTHAQQRYPQNKHPPRLVDRAIVAALVVPIATYFPFSASGVLRAAWAPSCGRLGTAPPFLGNKTAHPVRDRFILQTDPPHAIGK